MLPAPLVAAVLPFFLWPIQQLLPFGIVTEELAKVFIVYLVLKAPHSAQIKLLFFSGVLFSISEDVLYLFNMALVGNLPLLLTRLILTATLHLLTIFLIYIFAKKDVRLIIIGFIVAISVHWLFNQYLVSTLLSTTR